MHIELPDFLCFVAVFSLRLDIDLPLAAKAIEVIDEVSAHKGLKGLVHLPQINALLEHFVPVHIDEDLRDAGQEGRRHPLQFGPLTRRLEKLVDVSARKANILAGPVLKNEGDAAGGPNPGMAGGEKAKATASGNLPAPDSGGP